MSQIAHSREELQDTMAFMAALSSGLESFIGRAAKGMAFVAGKSMGTKYCEGAAKTSDVTVALNTVGDVLNKRNLHWLYEPFKKAADASMVTNGPDGGQSLHLVFRDCMIRQSLFRYGHAQQGSLCYMMFGFFSGALEAIMGRKAKLDIIHSGENSCLKKLTIE